MALGVLQPCPALPAQVSPKRVPACDVPPSQGSLFG